MITVTFLGTGCMQPTKYRNHSGVLLHFGKEYLLFDCGEAIQRQFRFADKKPSRVTRLLLTHFHGDHVFGIAGLLSAMGADNYQGTLQIYGPIGTKKYLSHLFKSFAQKDIVSHQIHEVTQGEVFSTPQFKVIAKPLKHSTPCLGYTLIEHDKRKILPSKLKKFKLEGPIVGELQQGKTITHDNKKITPNQVSVIEKGRKVAYVVDTSKCANVSALAKNTDLLIIEGTVLHELKEFAKKSGHLTVKQAAQYAKQNNVKQCIITHISQRYKDDKEILKEAKKEFKKVKIAKDFLQTKL